MKRSIVFMCLLGLLSACDDQNVPVHQRVITWWKGPPEPPAPPPTPSRTQLKVLMPVAPKAKPSDILVVHGVYVLTAQGCIESRKVCEVTAVPGDIREVAGKKALFAPACTGEREDFDGRPIHRHWAVFYPDPDAPGQYTAHLVSDDPGLTEKQATDLLFAPFCH